MASRRVSLFRLVLVLVAVAALGILVPGTASAASGNNSSTQACNGDPSGHSDSGHGANSGGPYDNTCSTSGPSRNGSTTANGSQQPCAGCVGSADDKNPSGQAPNASDPNGGYECDTNQGVAQGNPAHTGCAAIAVA